MNGSTFRHQFIDRETGNVVSEKLIGDRNVLFLYNCVREQAPAMFKALTGSRMSSLLGFLHFDLSASPPFAEKKLLHKFGVDPAECVEEEDYYTTHRKVFERQIQYWHCRPMPENQRAVVAPADSRILIGSFTDASTLFIKEKFFEVPELVGNKIQYSDLYQTGDFAVFRLTPDKYHYNHLPVDGRVEDTFEIDGSYHSCNPAATVSLASIFSKNRRMVTIIDTDVDGGTGVGRVAMIEIVALMIGDIVQCYSDHRYDSPRPLKPGDFCARGKPKSLFRPGSSTVVLLFEPGRLAFSPDLKANALRQDVQSRFSINFKKPIVETDVLVRSIIGSSTLITKGDS